MNTRQTTKSSKKGHSGRLLWRPLSLFSIFIFAVITAVPSLMAASGDFSIDFVAASPESYNHLTGGGAYDDRTVGVGNDIVESLEGGDFACGDIATFFAAVTVDDVATADTDAPQTIEMDFSFLMDTTGQSGAAIGDIISVGVNYAPIEDLITGEDNVDQGISDDGGSVATLIDEYATGPIFTAGSELWGTVELTDLERDEQVVVRIDVKLYCQPASNPTGNLQAALQAARLTFINDTTPVDPPQAVPGGAQTIPWKQIGNLAFPAIDVQKTVTTADGTCGVDDVESLTITAGDTVKYCYVVTNVGDPGTNLYTVSLWDDNGTPGDTFDDFEVTLSGLTDLAGDDGANDLFNGDIATGEALVTPAGPTYGESDLTVVNTATAYGDDSVTLPITLTDTDTATVIVQPPPVQAPQPRVIKGNVEGNDTIATLDEPGGSVTIDVVVYNDAVAGAGDATLTSLVDDIYGDITTTGHDGITATTCTTGGVIPGGGSYSCSFTVDITSEPGAITDTVTATLTNDATAVSDDDQANVIINDVAPTVTLVKSANPTTLPEPGGDFLFTLDITNTSAETVTITDLTDTQSAATNFSACSALIGTTLAPGASTSCQYTVSHADVGSYDNTASVTVEDNDGSTASDSDNEMVTVTDVLPTVNLTKEASPLSQDEPGGDFLFTLTIVNTSVEEVTITELSDNQSAEAVDFSACSSLVGTTLAAGASTSCQYTVNHTTPGSYDNTASVTVADNEANTASDSDSATVVVNDVPSAISMVKTAVPTEVTEPGGDVTYTFTVSNDSAVDSVTIDTLTDTVYGDLDGQGTCSVPQTIAPGGSYACSFTIFVSSSETNVATASGVDDDGTPVSASDDATVTVNDSFTNIVVTKTAVPTSVNEPGGDVTFAVTIDNPSTVDSVTINSLVDDIHGDLNGQGDCAVPQTIAIGGSYSCSFTAVVSGNAGDSETDTVTASGVDEDGVPVSDDDSAIVTVEDVQPTISVDKTADPTTVDEPGGEVTFTVVVTNNSVSSDPVTITSLTDDVHGDLNGQGDCAVPQTITSGDSYSCSFTATVSGNAGDSETDIVTASGNDDEGNPVSASDDATVTVNDVPSSILTTKTASPTSVPETGGDVTFTITVQNTSAVDDVTINTVDDDVFGDVSASCAPALPALLAPGESLTCTFTEFISGDYPDIHTNVATATGEDDDGNPVEDDDQEDVPFEDVLPDITVIKSASPSSVPETGGFVTFTFVATNNSLEAVSLDSMVDDTFSDLNGQGSCTLPQALGPIGDESASYTCAITVFLVADDLAAHINVVTATASDDDGNTATDTDDETVTFTDVAPQIELDKSASPTSVPETGGDVTFTFTVNNIGQEDVTLTSLTDTVFGNLHSQGDCAVPQTILIGGSYSCSITAFLSADDLADHYNVSTATAVDDDGTEDSDNDDETVTFEDLLPDVSITKTANPTSVPETGGNIEFTIIVTNNSLEDATIDSLVDSDFDLAAHCPDAVGTVLAFGESYTCAFTEYLTGDDLVAHENTATATASDNDDNSDTASDDETVTFTDVAPQIQITKSANPGSVLETGDDVTFTFLVENIGQEDVTLTSLTDTVFGDLNGQGNCVLPQTILIGDSYSCSITAFLSADDLVDHYNVSTATAVDDDGTPAEDSDDETVTFEDVLPDITVTKTADVLQVPETGGDVTFTFVVTNNNSEEVAISQLSDSIFGPLTGDADCQVGTVLAGNGGTCSFAVTFTLSADNLANHVNIFIGEACDDDNNCDTDDEDETVTFEDVLPDVSITKTANPTSVPETGGNVEFTIVVTNNSLEDATIDSLVDSDFDLAAHCPDAVGTVLAYSESHTCVFTEFILGDFSGPDHVNTATVIASDNEGNSDTASDDETVLFTDVLPDITVTKTAVPTSVPETGGLVSFEIVVTNNSSEDATLIDLDDSIIGDLNGIDDCTYPQFLPANGGSFTCTVVTFLTGDASGPDHYNVVTAVAEDDDGNTASDDDDATVTFEDVLPDITVVKTAVPTSIPETGGNVTFTFLVTNHSLEAATLDSLVDSDFGDLNNQGDCLVPQALAANGGTYTCSITVFLSGDASGPAHNNVVTATASDNEGNTDEDTDDETVLFDDVLPDVSITKTADPTSVPEPGANVEFTIAVTNNSLEDATIDSLLDSDFDLDAHCADAVGTVLASGASYTCTFTEFIAGNVGEDHQNTATIVASDNDGNSDTESDDADVIITNVTPVINIVKDGEATINEGGDTATYSFTITNNSVSTDPLTITSLTDDKFGDLLAEAEAANGGNPIVLNPSDSFSFSIDRDLTLNVGETHTNVVTVVGTDDEGDTATDDDDHIVGADNVAPAIEIVKDGEATINEGGDTATYSFTITNNSVSTDPLTITSLTDDQFGDLLAEAEAANGGNPIVLNPGDSFSFSIDRDLTLNVGETHTNVVTVVGTDDEGDTAKDNDDHIVGADNVAPVIEIVKDGEATINEGGDTATYNFLITNNSVSTDPLTITSLTDDKFGDLLAEAEAANGGNPIVLNPSDSFSFSIDRDLTLNVGETHTNVVTVVGIDDEGDTATDDDDHTVGADNVAPAIEIVKDGEATINEGGDTATYEFTITNNSVSTDPLTITSLVDDQFGDLLPEAEAANSGNPIVLAPGAGFSFEIDRDLTLNAGDTHINVVTVVGVDDEGTEATDNDDHTVGANDVEPVINIDKDGEATINEGGDTATYNFTITNNSVSTDPLTITSLTDDQFGDLLPEAEAANGGAAIVLNPGESFSFSIDRDLILDSGETHTNRVFVIAIDDEGSEAADDDDHVVTGANVDPVITVEKVPNQDQVFAPGEDVLFTIRVTNESVQTDPVTITSLVDDVFGDISAECVLPQTIGPNGTFECDVVRTISSDHTNTVTATGVDDEGTEVSDSASASVDMINPAISIEKSTGPADADTPPGPEILSGETVNWFYQVTNIGDVPLSNLTVTDDQGVTVICTTDTLPAGASTVCEATGTAIVGQYANIGTATGSFTDTDGDTANRSDSDPSHYFGVTPSVAIEKSTNGFDADAAPGPEILAGEAVTWEYLVTNTGNVDLTGIAVTDDVLGTICTVDLAAGTSTICSASGTADAGQYANLGTADFTYTDDLGNTATGSDDDPSHYFGATPSVDIEKSTNGFDADVAPGPEILAGEAVTWEYLVTNTGNVDLIDIAVTDDVLGTICTVDLLAGTSTTCSTSSTAEVGQYTNLGTADFTYTDDSGNTTTGSDDDPSHYFGATPSVDIVKTFADDSVIAGGAGSSFTLVVTNDGNVALDDVAVFDDVDDRLTITGVSGTAGVDNDSDADAQTVEWLIANLGVGESVTITVNFTVASDVEEANGAGDLNDALAVSNTATVSDTYTDDSGNSTDISDEDSDTVDILVDINLSIVKTFDPAEAPQGTFQSFTIEVSNAGPSDAVDVSVTDSVHSSLEVTGVSVTSGTGNCSASAGQEVDCTVQIPAGESVTITVDYFTAPFLDDDPSPYGTLGGDDFRFVFVNGSVLEGSTAGGPVYLDGVDITDQVTILTSLTRNDLIFDPPGDDPAFEMHLSCSDPFTGGWGQSAGPVEGVDVNWQIAFFSIARYNNNGFIKNCGNVVNPFDVPNTATATSEDSFGTETVSADATLTIVPGITIDRLQTKGKRLTVRLTNFTGEDKEIADVSAVWPDGNGDMIKVWLTQDGTSWVIWDGAAAPTETLLDSSVPGWNGATLLTGEGILRFDFQNKSADSGYVIRVNFTDGTFLDISVGTTAVTSSSITSTGSSSPGNGNGNGKN